MPKELSVDRGDLSRIYRRLDTKTIQKMEVAGIRKGAQTLRAAMRKLAPKRKSGLLHKNLIYTVQKEKGGAGVVAHIGPTYKAFYASFIEHGAKKHIIKGRKGKRLAIAGGAYYQVEHPGVKPAPFIRPAFDNNVNKIADAYIDGVWAGIEKEFLR